MSKKVEKILFADKAAKAWGKQMPKWIEVLAISCDAKGMRQVAKAIGYSPAVISTVLSCKYAGDFSRVEAKVRGALMASTVRCPFLKLDIGLNQCLDNQKRPLTHSSSWRPGLYRACRSGCPHSRLPATMKGGQLC